MVKTLSQGPGHVTGGYTPCELFVHSHCRLLGTSEALSREKTLRLINYSEEKRKTSLIPKKRKLRKRFKRRALKMLQKAVRSVVEKRDLGANEGYHDGH